jgi:hypothetical protein
MNSKLLPTIALGFSLALTPLRSDARDIQMEFSTPHNTVPTLVQVKLKIPGTPGSYLTIPIMIPPGINAHAKAQLIGTTVAGYGLTVEFFPQGLPAIIIKNLKPAVHARFVDFGTGERPDKIKFVAPSLPPLQYPAPGYGYYEPLGHFNPFDHQNQPAIFTAGIVTDVGELAVQVSAEELNFQTDGPIICQALFQRLAPQAPQYGVTLDYAFDRLEVYFDPAYTVTQGGIIFGSSSSEGESAAGVILPPDPLPAPVEFKFSLPINALPAQIMFNLNVMDSGAASVPVMIEPGTSVLAKRDKVVDALSTAGAEPIPTGPDKCLVGNIAPGSPVRVTDLGSCEANDSMKSPGVTQVTAGFPGFFEPLAPNSLPAIFTAGIVTDVGELSVQVSAQELNFQTDGPIICQALFQRLAPRAPQYGAQLNYAGDRLEVYFDPAYTVTQGGIIFGSSSPTPGNFGEIVLPLPPPPPVMPGDMNGDGEVNALDIRPFIMAITSPGSFEDEYPGVNILNGDLNGDGAVDELDIDPFILTVMNGG